MEKILSHVSASGIDTDKLKSIKTTAAGWANSASGTPLEVMAQGTRFLHLFLLHSFFSQVQKTALWLLSLNVSVKEMYDSLIAPGGVRF